MTSLFEALPIELTEYIVTFVELRDVATLRLTSRDIKNKASQGCFTAFFKNKNVVLTTKMLQEMVHMTSQGRLGRLLQCCTVSGIACEETTAVDEGTERLDLLTQAFCNLKQRSPKGELVSLHLRVVARIEAADGELIEPHEFLSWRAVWNTALHTFNIAKAALSESQLSVENHLNIFGSLRGCSLESNTFLNFTRKFALLRVIRSLKKLTVRLSDSPNTATERPSESAAIEIGPQVQSRDRDLVLQDIMPVLRDMPELESLDLQWHHRGHNISMPRVASVARQDSNFGSEPLYLKDYDIREGGTLVHFDVPGRSKFPYRHCNMGPSSLERQTSHVKDAINYRLAYGRPLGSGERMRWLKNEAWESGPIRPSVYDFIRLNQQREALASDQTGGRKHIVRLNEQQGAGLADPALLDKIDKLFACNVGEHIDLPQLVVIGDQSSGKSSVLEGLTALPFPRDSGLCTRFATQITFRRTKVESVSVSVIASADASQEHAEKVKAWQVHVPKLDKDAFADIMTQVPNVMGLSANKNDTSSTSTFSSDVLRLEIHGPKEDHLSVIDVPGIFKNTTPGLTTKKDILMVREMVQGYMKNPRSVMIAVVPANVDIATQEILGMAREVDSEGQRTIGVFTKPDLVDRGAEANVVDLLEGKGPNGKLGWSMVRNPGQQELTDGTTKRQSLEEDFFRFREPWNKIDKDRVGVAALRKRLQATLTAHIRREFPKVKMEISRKLATSKEKVGLLGASRETKDQQNKYLLGIASQFQHVTSLARTAQYGTQVCFKSDDALRLPTLLANRNEYFAHEMEHYGHEHVFLSLLEATNNDTEANATSSLEVGPADGISESISIEVRKWETEVELEDILLAEVTVASPSHSSITAWLEKIHTTSRGDHLGTFNPGLLSIAMHEQSAKWENLALGYTSDVVAIVHEYIVRLLTYLCPDENVRSRILAFLLDRLIERYRKGLEQTRFLLGVERNGTLRTMNHYFNENLKKSYVSEHILEGRQKRRESALSTKAFDDCQHGRVVRFEDITTAEPPMSNTEHTIREMHDILHSYYKVARKRFVDNVCMQAVDHHLISGPDSPLELFNSDFVTDLSEQELEDIAGEDEELKRQRRQLEKEIKDLEAGRKILL
ncbi:MAG: hypothetical protein Q9165_003878 [Trypethelium subeluteriae]